MDSLQDLSHFSYLDCHSLWTCVFIHKHRIVEWVGMEGTFKDHLSNCSAGDRDKTNLQVFFH